MFMYITYLIHQGTKRRLPYVLLAIHHRDVDKSDDSCCLHSTLLRKVRHAHLVFDPPDWEPQ